MKDEGAKKPAFRFVDLFAGIGGFHQAMAALGGECVFACEIDPACRAVYEKNYGIVPAGDVRLVKAEDVPVHDVLCAGFPCQTFSKVGKRLGFADEARGKLFYEIVRVLEAVRPKYVVLENVRAFVTHDGGNAWKTAAAELRGLGYRVADPPPILSPHMFGTPQIRERVLILGKLDPENADVPLEVGFGETKRKEDCTI